MNLGKNLPRDLQLVECENFWKQRLVPEKTILLAKGLGPGALLQLAYTTRVENIIQPEVMSAESEIQCSATLIKDPRSFLNDPGKAILGAECQKTFAQKFTSSKEKQDYLKAIRAAVFNIPQGRSVVDAVVAIADELFTNAIYNAPTGHGASRKSAVVLDAPNFGEIFVNHNDEYLVIGCRDTYGSLVLEAVLFNLYDIYQRGIASSIRPGTGGAGIGFRMMFGHCVSSYIVVDPARETLVCFALQLGSHGKRRQVPFKNIHFRRIGSGLMGGLKTVRGSFNDMPILQMFGIINEDANFDSIELPEHSELLLDGGGITSINSCGTREFIAWIKEISAQRPIVYLRCSRVLVEQLGIVDGFLPPNARVESVYVPYFCENCESVTSLLIEQKDFPTVEKMTLPASIKCSNCEKDAQIDIIEHEYFRFLPH